MLTRPERGRPTLLLIPDFAVPPCRPPLPSQRPPRSTPRPGAAALRALLWMAALLLGLALAPLARAQGVDLVQLSTERAEDGLQLNFSTRFELSRNAEDALHKGVPLYFTAEVQVLRGRWYWRDTRIARVSRSWRLNWQPLDRQYRVSTGGLIQSYPSLAEALASVRGVSGWHLADARDIEDEGRYYLEFSYRLDTSQLPRPLQIGLGTIGGFALNVERVVALQPDFSLRSPSP